MIANVNEQVWIDFGLDIAVFLDTMAYWIKKNAANKQPRNFHEGRYWTYNTQEAFQKMFPGWSRETIRRIIRNCVKHGLLIIGNFNKKSFDRTNWYSLTDKAVEYYSSLWLIMRDQPCNPDKTSCVDSNQASVDSNPPIPKELPSVSNINITISDILEIYHQELPDLPKVKKVDSKLNYQLRKMIKSWSSYQKDGKEFSLESFRDYLQMLKKHYSWFLEPYTTESGRPVKSSLRKITREYNMSRIVNGEFSAK